MKIVPILFAIAASSSLLFAQQQERPVPKDSARLSISGCARGRVFTVRRNPEHPEELGTHLDEGRHLRLEGNKKALQEIKAHEGSMVEISGLIKRSDIEQRGIGLAGGRVRIVGAMPQRSGPDPGPSVAVVDVESWRLLNSSCPSK